MTRPGFARLFVVTALFASLPALSAPAFAADAVYRDRVRASAKAMHDRREDRRDLREDVRDRREDRRDARHVGGRRDRIEDVRDRREDRRDLREDRRDRRH